MSAVVSMEQPCPRHLMMRTTVDFGSLVYSSSEPCRWLKRWPQALQYSRRMALFLPIHSTTQRLPALNWLNNWQWRLGQAKAASDWSSLADLELDMGRSFAEKGLGLYNPSAKGPDNLQILPYPCQHHEGLPYLRTVFNHTGSEG
ncbi:MAG: hypothetical protein KAV87_60610 [Desulfobacteraceae bacterium]|nr:hypothetical protein [Desulfobacteraceae bacterium]